MLLHPELTITAVVALAALVCGVGMAALRQSAVVGYILAGVVLGPSGLGLVSNRENIAVLAEFGVLMLLFLIGMELDLRRFMGVWKVALPVTLVQVSGSVGVTLLLAAVTSWSNGAAVLFGFVVALSSTAVVIKTLESAGELDSDAGRVTLGILVAQDMAVVPMTLVLQGIAADGFSAGAAIRIGLSLVFLVGLVLFLVRREIDLPFGNLVSDDGDLPPLAALAWCFGAAALAGLLDLSPAYGAFLAGLTLGNSRQQHTIIRAAHPIQAVLLMVFFLSIGLLMDLAFIWENLRTVLILLAVVTLFKTGLNVLALRLLGKRWPTALLAGVALAQIGEFSFLLSETGLRYGLISDVDARLVVAVTVLSLILTPLWLLAARRLHALAQSGIASRREVVDDFGFGRAGVMARLADRLTRRRRQGRWDAGP